MSEMIVSGEELPRAGMGPIPPSFEHVVDAFCLQQTEFRATLARLWDGKARPSEGCNGNIVTDNSGGRHDAQE
jgi:hypothetical protein